MSKFQAPNRDRQIYDEMLANSLLPILPQRTDADRIAGMTNEQFARLRQSAIGFAEPTTSGEKFFKKIAPGLWRIWAAWKELQ